MTEQLGIASVMCAALGIKVFPGTETHLNQIPFKEFVATYGAAFTSPGQTIVTVEGRNGRIFILDSLEEFWKKRREISGKRGIEGMARMPLDFWRKYMHDAYPVGRVTNLTSIHLAP